MRVLRMGESPSAANGVGEGNRPRGTRWAGLYVLGQADRNRRPRRLGADAALRALWLLSPHACGIRILGAPPYLLARRLLGRGGVSAACR